jgi:hypothetical protein
MNITWRLGVSGDFATASNWNPAAVPGPADDVTIGVKGTYTVTSSASQTVDSLTIADKHATLFINGSSFTTITGGVNGGTITLSSGNIASSGTLDNNNVISGTGGIGVATLVNNVGGIIDASGVDPLFITSSLIENSGTLESTSSVGLEFPMTGSTIDNTPFGVIEAVGANSRVALAEVTIVGGTLKTKGANAVIDIGPSYVTFDGTQPGNPVNVEGNVRLASEDDLFLEGTINNTGVITLVGGALPWVICEGNVTLEGGGDITLTNPYSMPLVTEGAIFGGVLTNVDNFISGTGEIGQQTSGSGVGTFVNETKGVIDADASTPLIIAGVGPDTNAGLIEATQAGTLLIQDVTIDNFLNGSQGTVKATRQSTVGLENATIVGGLVKALPGSMIEAEQGSNTITGADVKNAGTIGAEGANFTIIGDVHNHKGNLDANNATLVIDGAVKGGTATIEGTGEIEFGGGSSADVTFAANSDGTLKLDQPSAFTGTVSGLTTGDYIDLPNINFADNPTLSYSSKTEKLTVSDSVSGVTDTIKFEGSVGPFTTQSDSNGGTLISDPSAAGMVDNAGETINSMEVYSSPDLRDFQFVGPATDEASAGGTITPTGVYSSALNLTDFSYVGPAADQAMRFTETLPGFSPAGLAIVTSPVSEAGDAHGLVNHLAPPH